MKRFVRAVVVELRRAGATGVEHEPRPGHDRVYFDWAGQRRHIVVSSTPSARDALGHVRSDIRRTMEGAQ